MAFMIHEKESSVEDLEGKDCERVGGNGISSQLQLKPSLSSNSNSKASKTLDKQVVLRRIRQRKSYNKAKSALEALLGTSSEANNSASASAQEPIWLQLGDNFSAP